MEHPDFCSLPKLEDYFRFVNQNIDKQSNRILRKKFENVLSIEQFFDYFAELQVAHFLFNHIHPQSTVEFIKEEDNRRTPDIRINIKSKNVSVCVEVTSMSSELSRNDQLKKEKLSQNQGEMTDVTHFNKNGFYGLIDKLRGKKSQFRNCKADYKIFAVVSSKWSINSSYFEYTDIYRDIKSDFQSCVDGILFFGCRGETKLFSFNPNLKSFIGNVEYYENEN